MLSEIIYASVKTEREEKSDRVPGISGSSLYPCPYRMYLVHIGKYWNEGFTPQQILNLEDGWDQEEQAVRRLERAGVVVKDRQNRVYMGESKIPGSFDGKVTLNGIDYIWEFKAMNSDRFQEFSSRSLKGFINYKSQIQGYLLGSGVSRSLFQAKHKDSNDYKDIVETLDLSFISPIIEWCDRIRLEGWVPKPKECIYCSNCGMDCFGKKIDFSWLETVDELEMAQKWIKGKQYQDVGGMLIDEARAYFIGVKDKFGNFIKRGLIGDRDLLTASGIEVKKITQHRLDVNKQKLVEEFGAEALLRVSDESNIVQYRIREV